MKDNLKKPQILINKWIKKAKTDEALAWALGLAKDAQKKYISVKAEEENFARRKEIQIQESLRKGKTEGALALVDSVESLERALEFSKDKEGLEMIRDELLNRLKTLGVEEVDSVRFDPALHKAVKGKGKKILKVLRKGYVIDGRILRPAMVELEKGKAS